MHTPRPPNHTAAVTLAPRPHTAPPHAGNGFATGSRLAASRDWAAHPPARNRRLPAAHRPPAPLPATTVYTDVGARRTPSRCFPAPPPGPDTSPRSAAIPVAPPRDRG